MACTLDQQATVFGDNRPWRDSTSREQIGNKFTPGTTGTVCKITVRLWKAGSPTGNAWVEIWTDSSGLPSAQIGSDSSTVDVSTFASTGGAAQQYDFTFATEPNITASTVYHIVLNSDASISATNFLRVGTEGGVNDGTINIKNSSEVWSNDSEGIVFEYDQYTEPTQHIYFGMMFSGGLSIN